MFTEKEVEDILSAVDQKLAGLSKSETANSEVESAERKDVKKMENGKKITNTGTSTPEDDRNGTADSPKAGQSVAKMGMGMAPDEDSDAPMMDDGQQDGNPYGDQMGGEEGYEATSPGEQDMGDQFGDDAAPQEMGMEGDMMDDGELSDEELDEIYSSMDDQELERHYMILRQHMQGRYQKAEIAMKNELKEQEGEKINKSDTSNSSEGSNSEEMSANETELVKKNEEMQTELTGLKEQLVALTQVFEKSINKPSRKAVVQENELEFVQKTEGGRGEEPPAAKDFSQDDLRKMSNDKAKENLTKDERQVINDYFIYGENKGELIKLLVGGKE